MANMRVHELAKELNISSKEVIDILSNDEKTYKTMSGLKDEEIAKVRNKLTKKTESTQPKAEAKPQNNDKKPEVKTEVKPEVKADNKNNKSVQQAEDKKHISKVYFPQNSQRGDQPRNDRNDRNNNDRSDRNNQSGGYRNNFNDRNERNNDRNGQERDFQQRGDRNNQSGGYRNNDRNNQRDGQNGFRRDGGQNRSSQGFGGSRRNDKPSGGDEFLFETKPDSRRPDSRKDNKKNDRKKDNESKENLKFVNGQMNKKQAPKAPEKKEEDTIKQLILPDSLTIKELADKMKVQPSAVVKKLFLQGKVVTINQEIDYDTAEEIALEFNCICDHEVKVDVIAELLKEDEDAEETLVPR
ncbi:MAG: translation initiation factor IF-2 N-terminal domain-containing protein, partial [Lachnospira sp.]|nr:translation initiation factor IF-2 N-terminal domain-containing protein [Lachnospira sp.]